MTNELCHDKRQRVAIEKREKYSKSDVTKKVYVATRFVSRRSTPGRVSRDKETPIATNETGRRQKQCHNKGYSVMTRN